MESGLVKKVILALAFTVVSGCSEFKAPYDMSIIDNSRKAECSAKLWNTLEGYSRHAEDNPSLYGDRAMQAFMGYQMRCKKFQNKKNSRMTSPYTPQQHSQQPQ